MVTFLPRKYTIPCVAGGITMMTVGIFIALFVPLYLMPLLIKNTFAIDQPSSKGIPPFLKLPKASVTIYQSFYIFNLTNPEEVESGAAGPKVTEHGPYTYRLDRQKMANSLVWRADGTLEYLQHSAYYFEPSMSSGSESDVFTTANLGYIGALNKMRDSEFAWGLIRDKIKQDSVPLFMTGDATSERRIRQLNVSQFIWGYNNTLLEALAPLGVSPLVQMLSQDDYGSKDVLPAAVVTGGKVGPGYAQTSDDDFKRMTMWNGMNRRLTYWNSDYANMINGSDGTAFHPYVTEKDISETNANGGLYVFSDTIYRSALLVDCGRVEKEGIKLYCVHMRGDTLLNGDHNPANKAFGMTSSGLLPLPKSVGKPIHLSLPRFFRGNRSDPLIGKVEFLTKKIGRNNKGEEVEELVPAPEPEQDTSDTVLFIEPFTGQLLDAHKRLQINTFLEPGVTALNSNTTHTYLPLMWADQYPIVTDEAIKTIKVKIYLPFYGSIVLGAVLSVAGALLTIVAVVRCTCVRRHKYRHELDSALYSGLSTGGADNVAASANKRKLIN